MNQDITYSNIEVNIKKGSNSGGTFSFNADFTNVTDITHTYKGTDQNITEKETQTSDNTRGTARYRDIITLENAHNIIIYFKDGGSGGSSLPKDPAGDKPVIVDINSNVTEHKINIDTSDRSVNMRATAFTEGDNKAYPIGLCYFVWKKNGSEIKRGVSENSLNYIATVSDLGNNLDFRVEVYTDASCADLVGACAYQVRVVDDSIADTN